MCMIGKIHYFKVSFQYKLYNAVGFLLVFLFFLWAYYAWGNDVADLSGMALVWGISLLLLYYTFIGRMKIGITANGRWLVYKPANSLTTETIELSKVSHVELRKRFFMTEVVVCDDSDVEIVLHPEDCSMLLKALK